MLRRHCANGARNVFEKNLEECIYDDYPTALPMHKSVEIDLDIYMGLNR